MTRDPSPAATLPRAEHVRRVNAAIDYIESHLASDLSLETLAGVAHFSPFHFHRVFRALTTETLNEFVSRLRVERAAELLSLHPSRSVTAISVEMGYSSPSVFARAFKERFGMSATTWRKSGTDAPFAPSRIDEDADTRFGILGAVEDDSGLAWRIRAGRLPETTVAVRVVDAQRVAYVRRTGPYRGRADVYAEAFSALFRWAQPRGWANEDSVYFSIAHDPPDVTSDARHRISVGLTVDDSVEPSGEVGTMTIAPGAYAVARFELGERDYTEAWQSMMSGWLPESGYETDERLPFERYSVRDRAAAPGRIAVEIWVPVRPLRDY